MIRAIVNSASFRLSLFLCVGFTVFVCLEFGVILGLVLGCQMLLVAFAMSSVGYVADVYPVIARAVGPLTLIPFAIAFLTIARTAFQLAVEDTFDGILGICVLTVLEGFVAGAGGRFLVAVKRSAKARKVMTGVVVGLQLLLLVGAVGLGAADITLSSD